MTCFIVSNVVCLTPVSYSWLWWTLWPVEGAVVSDHLICLGTFASSSCFRVFGGCPSNRWDWLLINDNTWSMYAGANSSSVELSPGFSEGILTNPFGYLYVLMVSPRKHSGAIPGWIRSHVNVLCARTLCWGLQSIWPLPVSSRKCAKDLLTKNVAIHCFELCCCFSPMGL